MINSILGIKKEMNQVFLADGTRIPITLVKAGPCLVTQIKTKDKDGYQAVQLGVGQKKRKRATKPIIGHLKKIDSPKKGKRVMIPRVLKEVRIKEDQQIHLKVGDLVNANQVLTAGDIVNITGTSRGKGFTGVMKRWGFKGGPRTHGQSDRERAPGSIGQSTTPGRVFKGKKMPGRSGSARVTIRNLQVVKVTEEGEVWLKGQVPGSKNGVVIIKKVGKSPKFKGLYEEKPAKEKEEKPDRKTAPQKRKK
jgi:large subunit ribosomal protein L3